ncbi:MAG: DUF2007 domain-containing protein [Mangrovibacterium sp.]
MEKDFEAIYSTPNNFEAELVRGMLIENNIPCVILKKQDSPHLLFGCFELYVHRSQLEEAKDLLKQNNE